MSPARSILLRVRVMVGCETPSFFARVSSNLMRNGGAYGRYHYQHLDRQHMRIFLIHAYFQPKNVNLTTAHSQLCGNN